MQFSRTTILLALLSVGLGGTGGGSGSDAGASGARPNIIVNHSETGASTDEKTDLAPVELDRIVTRMTAEGRHFDPTDLIKRQAAGCRAILRRVFPEAFSTNRLGRQRAKELIGQLGADSFERRETATSVLKARGRDHADVLKEATQDDDAEIRFRAAYILRSWDREEAGARGRNAKLAHALEEYTARLNDEATQKVLAECVVTALRNRLDETPKRECLGVCTRALANSKKNTVHNILLPLLKHEDPAVPIFAMKHIAGRTGNSYVAPIHLQALESGKPELVKTALGSMPCPIWDRYAKPRVRAFYEQLFAGEEDVTAFTADMDFMMLSAFVAARDFQIDPARAYLLGKIGSDDKKIALRAIQALGDTYYRKKPVYPELLAALAPHFASDDPKFRRAAVETLGFYKGPEVVDALLIALGDPDEKVYKEAAQAIVDYYWWYGKQASPIGQTLRQAQERTDNLTTRKRIERLLEFFSSSPTSPLLEW